MSYKVSSDGFNGSITFLISENGASLELYDRASGTRFARVELDVQQLAELLSRRADTPCDIELRGLDRVGKLMVMSTLEFEMPESTWENRKDVAIAEAVRLCPEGWSPDAYFGGQSSFFTKEGKQYARTTIRQWVSQ